MKPASDSSGISVLAAFLLMLAISPVLAIVTHDLQLSGSGADVALNLVACALFVVLVLMEIPRMKSSDAARQTADRGFVSGMLTILAVFYLPAIDALILKILNVTDGRLPLFLCGLVFAAIGAAIRWLAAHQLGQSFSHEIRIREDHRLISSGLYARVRHPAYSGTLFVLVGMSLMLGSYVGLILFPLALLAILKRVEIEECVLIEAFQGDYEDYQARTHKLLPWVL